MFHMGRTVNCLTDEFVVSGCLREMKSSQSSWVLTECDPLEADWRVIVENEW
jgi:hypothetical protein